jgi:excisionase family DNA binding protein
VTAESAPDGDVLVTVSEALSRIKMGRSWLYDALNSGLVHGVRFGRSWRLHESTVADLARNGAPNPK